MVHVANGEAPAKRPRLFLASEQKRIMRGVVGKPSGVIAEIGVFKFDLVAISAGELIGVLDLAIKLADGFDKVGSGELSDSAIFRMIGEDGARIVALAKTILWRSPVVGYEDHDKDEGEFEKWFNDQPAVEMIKTLLPLVLEANGVKLGRPQIATPDEAPISTPSTPSDTSSHITPPTITADA